MKCKFKSMECPHAGKLTYMGDKCFYELDDLLDMYNLSWGMDVDSYYAAFGTLIKS